MIFHTIWHMSILLRHYKNTAISEDYMHLSYLFVKYDELCHASHVMLLPLQCPTFIRTIPSDNHFTNKTSNENKSNQNYWKRRSIPSVQQK